MQTLLETLGAVLGFGGALAGVAGVVVLFAIGVKAATVTFLVAAALALWGAVVYMALTFFF